MKLAHLLRMIALCVIVLAALTAVGQVTALTPYSVSVFARSVPGVYFQPDSIALLGGHVFIGFGDGAAPDGSDGKNSTFVEYDLKGHVITTYTVKGHNDGLKVNPRTKELWAMQNEDARPNLVIIDPKAIHNANSHSDRRRIVADTTIWHFAARRSSSAHRILRITRTTLRQLSGRSCEAIWSK